MFRKAAVLFVLCLSIGMSVFFRDKNVMTVSAYTEEEKAAAKAWLSQNGYPPTMAGAEQAYQDYLNGKFGPVGDNGIPDGSTPQTPDESNEAVTEDVPADTNHDTPVNDSKAEESDAASSDEVKTDAEQDTSDTNNSKGDNKNISDDETKATGEENTIDIKNRQDISETKTQKEVSQDTSNTKTNKNQGETIANSRAKVSDEVLESETVDEMNLEIEAENNMYSENSSENKNSDSDDGQIDESPMIRNVILFIIIVAACITITYLIVHFRAVRKKEEAVESL